MHLIPLLLLVLAWWRVEFRENNSSNGIGSMISGCSIFGFGAVNLTAWDKILSGSIIAVGLFIALVGTGRYVIYQIKP